MFQFDIYTFRLCLFRTAILIYIISTVGIPGNIGMNHIWVYKTIFRGVLRQNVNLQ